MNTIPEPDAPITTDGAILANLEVLDQMLAHARYLVGDAAEAMHAGRRNLAIGTIAGLEQLLPEIEALYRTALILLRTQCTQSTIGERTRT
jgi:hypothetical protein